MKIYEVHEDKHKCCCSCDHRVVGVDHCDIDKHFIGYVKCFNDYCEYWTDEVYMTLFDENGIRK